jgi:hypothetical protein
MGTFVFWACSTRLIIWDRNVSFPTLVTSTCSEPLPLMVAPRTLSPVFFRTGIDSPVAIDSSI